MAARDLGLLAPEGWTTLVINLTRPLLLGFLVPLGAGWSTSARDILGLGFLGDFTNFSTFSAQVVLEATEAGPGEPWAYAALSVTAAALG